MNKSQKINSEEEIEGYYYKVKGEHYIVNDNFIEKIKPYTLKVKCSEGNFIPVEKAKIVNEDLLITARKVLKTLELKEELIDMLQLQIKILQGV